ncbi:MAG: alpha/beta hydrolase [Nitratireductor sp.]|nr:alpha/beta hydrolase [Nitratireductor sp.]
MTAWAQQSLSSPTGATLNLYVQQAVGTPRAVIQVNHGMAEHAARYARFAAFLSQNGYACLAHDHRGHGYTSAPDAPRGVFARTGGWETVIADVAAVNAFARQTFPGTPVVAFGHSMGAIIAMNHVLRHAATVDAAAIWNSSFDDNLLAAIGTLLLRMERMFKGSDVPSSLAPKLTFDAWNARFRPNRTRFDWLSRDEAEVDKYVADPLCGFDVSVGLWLDVISGVQYAAKTGNLAALPRNLPFHMLGGRHDPASDQGQSIARLAAKLLDTGVEDVSVELLDDTRHECLNDLGRDQVMAGFVHWLDDRFAA